MFEYMICNQSDEEIFNKQCAALTKHIPGLQKDLFLEDVDGSLIQIFKLNGAKIKVLNDRDINQVWIDSEVDIDPYFGR
jgi:hypothetical protein